MPDSDDAGPFGRYAKEYRKQGWVAPLPLPPNAKEAPPAGYHGNNKRIPVLNEIRKWLRDNGTGNICLALSTVERPADVPFTYDGKQVTEWEHIAIDIDDYGEKHGWAEYCALVGNGLPELPATIASSARWSANEHSNLRVFLVPTGYVYHGKVPGCKHIDVIASNLRYMVAFPSVHPTGSAYTWRVGGSNGWEDIGGVPAANEARVLPEPWFNHIVKRGERQGSNEDSGLEFDELWDWAGETFHAPDTMCEFMEREVTKYISELDASNLHEPLTRVLSRLTKNCLEGHSGYQKATLDYINTWFDVAGERGDRDPDTMRGEIQRSVSGALNDAKIAWDECNQYVPVDTCAKVNGRADNWSANEVADRVAAGDYGGLGNVVGKMEVLNAKPANEYGMHDDGNAQHFIDVYSDNVKYVDGRDGWVVWDGWRWHRDINARYVGLAYRRVRDNQEKYVNVLRQRLAKNPKAEGLKSLIREWNLWSRRSGNVGAIKAALDIASWLNVHEEPVAIPANMFDSNPKLLGCTNGVLVLDDDPDIRPPRKEDYVTYNTNVPYMPWRSLANSEGEVLEGWQLWNEYLEIFLPDPDVRRYVQKVLGHLIVGENPEKLIVFMYGPHDTGKSTMLGGILGALGDYYGAVDINLFKPKDLNPGLIRACPLRVVGMSEVDAGTMDGPTVKRITGNDMVSAEAKYSNVIFQGRPQFTAVVACNNPPNITPADEALNERIMVLPFLKTIDRSHRRYERQTQIERHSGVAVFSWMVEGWKLYCVEGLGEQPVAVRKLRNELVSNLNATQTFIHEMLEKAADSDMGRRALRRAELKAAKRNRARATVADLERDWTPTASMVYQLYTRWCQANGVKAVGHPEFSKELGIGKPQPKGIEGKVQRCYFGVRMKDVEITSSWRQK